MAVEKVIWWQHSSKSGQHSSAKVHRTLRQHIEAGKPLDTENIKDSLMSALPDLEPEIIDGF